MECSVGTRETVALCRVVSALGACVQNVSYVLPSDPKVQLCITMDVRSCTIGWKSGEHLKVSLNCLLTDNFLLKVSVCDSNRLFCPFTACSTDNMTKSSTHIDDRKPRLIYGAVTRKLVILAI